MRALFHRAKVHQYLIFNAFRGVCRKARALVGLERVYSLYQPDRAYRNKIDLIRLDEPDRTDGDEVFDVDAGIFKPARDVGDKPQVVLDEFAARRFVACVHFRKSLALLRRTQRRGK